MAATRVRTAKVAIQLKRLGRKPERGYRTGRYYSEDKSRPWEVITVTVRGVNEHTGHPMVTWPDGTKGDDEEVGRYNSSKPIYFPITLADEKILLARKAIDENERWLEKNMADVMKLAKDAVSEALKGKE